MRAEENGDAQRIAGRRRWRRLERRCRCTGRCRRAETETVHSLPHPLLRRGEETSSNLAPDRGLAQAPRHLGAEKRLPLSAARRHSCSVRPQRHLPFRRCTDTLSPGDHPRPIPTCNSRFPEGEARGEEKTARPFLSSTRAALPLSSLLYRAELTTDIPTSGPECPFAKRCEECPSL